MTANGAGGDGVADDRGRRGGGRGRATMETGMPPHGGPPLLFVHGFLGEAADWDGLRALLGAEGAAACFELPGHGAAPPLTGAAPERCADAAHGLRQPGTSVPEAAASNWFPDAARRLEQACARLPAPPVVVGYSMGGRLALYTAVRRPRAACALVLLGADPGIAEPAARAERRARDEALACELAAVGDEQAFAAWLRRWYAAPLFGRLNRNPAFEELLRRRLRQLPEALAAALRGLSVARQPYLWSALRAVPIPALFIAGAGDTKYRAVAQRIAALGAPWHAAVVPDAAHAVHVEQPRAVAGLVRSFALRRAT